MSECARQPKSQTDTYRVLLVSAAVVLSRAHPGVRRPVVVWAVLLTATTMAGSLVAVTLAMRSCGSTVLALAAVAFVCASVLGGGMRRRRVVVVAVGALALSAPPATHQVTVHTRPSRVAARQPMGPFAARQMVERALVGLQRTTVQ